MCFSTKTEPEEISKTKLFKLIVLSGVGEHRRELRLNGSVCLLPVGKEAQQDPSRYGSARIMDNYGPKKIG